MAPTSSGSVPVPIATATRLAACRPRNAVPTARRTASGSRVPGAALPSPAATTRGVPLRPSVGILIASSASPVASAARNAASRTPPSAASSPAAPSASATPLPVETVATTITSAVTGAAASIRETEIIRQLYVRPRTRSGLPVRHRGVRSRDRCGPAGGGRYRCAMTELRRSPLHDRHVDLGAKMADFGGWQMPIEYGASGGGVIAEHTAVRSASASSTSRTWARPPSPVRAPATS